MVDANRLARQIAFLVEADKVKQIVRRNHLCDASRCENDAEHMWHLALMAVVLVEHAAGDVDLLHVLRMLLIHDLVEIDAGDTFAYDAAAHGDKYERESRAAERIFGLLPGTQGAEFRALWEEFETRETPVARYANALDRIAPMLLNLTSGCGAYREHGITPEKMRARNQAIVMEGCAPAWEFVEAMIGKAAAEGLFEAVAAARPEKTT